MSGTITPMLTPEIEARLKKWKVKLRNEPQTVHHETYGTDTILSPEQFACYEAALKAIYTHWFIAAFFQGSPGAAMGVMAHHDQIAARNDIRLPWIPQKYFSGRLGKVSKLGEDFMHEAAADYHFFANILRNQNGKNVKTGEPANLYYATLD